MSAGMRNTHCRRACTLVQPPDAWQCRQTLNVHNIFCDSEPGYLLNRTAFIPTVPKSHERDTPTAAAAAVTALSKKPRPSGQPSSDAFVRCLAVLSWLPPAAPLVLVLSGFRTPTRKRVKWNKAPLRALILSIHGK